MSVLQPANPSPYGSVVAPTNPPGTSQATPQQQAVAAPAKQQLQR